MRVSPVRASSDRVSDPISEKSAIKRYGVGESRIAIPSLFSLNIKIVLGGDAISRFYCVCFLAGSTRGCSMCTHGLKGSP